MRPDQRRFATSVADVLALQRAVRGPLVNAGVAVHSLRAARPQSIVALAEGSAGPLHIHVAEQTAEVDDCVAATGCRPIEWLTRHAPLDTRWQLVHATHSVPAEIEAVAARGAGVVFCPGTEGNLGDGLADLPGWLAAGVPAGNRLGQPGHARLARGAALARIRPAPRPAPAQRVGRAGCRGVDRGAAVRARQRGRRRGSGLCTLGPAGRCARRPARARSRDPALRGLPADRLLDGAVSPHRSTLARVMVAGRWRAVHDEGIATRLTRDAGAVGVQRYVHAPRLTLAGALRGRGATRPLSSDAAVG